MAGNPLPVFRSDFLHRVGDRQLLAVCNLRVYRRGEADRQAGGAVYRIQHRGAGDQPGLHVAVRGKIRAALHAGENRRHGYRHVLELRDETESGSGMNLLIKNTIKCTTACLWNHRRAVIIFRLNVAYSV